MRTFEEIKTTVEAGLGRIPCDLKLENVQLVNVYSAEIYSTDIYIKDKRIVSIEPNIDLAAKEVIPCQGQYALPGLIDTHMHFESTLLSPEALAAVMVPQGTTTICVDLMEIANVAGAAGIKTMLQSMSRLPYRMLIEVSSRVPTAPGLETTGAVLGVAEVEEILNWEESCSLGEIDPSKILFVQDEYLQKIAATLARRKVVNGHAIGRLAQELNVYASAGISDDHECVDYEELLARIRLGMKVMVREGSTERNLEKLMTGVMANSLDYDNLIFCTDDKHASEIREEGHINYNINKAVALGVPFMKAMQMATINAAKHFRVEDELGSITPGRLADILLVKDLQDVKPVKVIFEGKVVAEAGKLSVECPPVQYPQWIKESVTFKQTITAQSFAVKAKTNQAKTTVNVIELCDEQIINEWGRTELAVEHGVIGNAVAQDILKLAVVERYGKTGGVGVGFVKGFGLKKGALAFSTSHDHHNIVCVGTNDADMAVGVNAIHEMQGGLVVVDNGKVIAKMQLLIGGLMSEKSADEVLEEIEAMNMAARTLGCPLPAPFMTLSFISLPTVPKLGLTDKGLVDVLAHKLIAVEAD
ncbi:adenine deaminase [Sporomusa sphaeroides]|uniref:Adenine deaminase n=1 Tax=Sporomusa sphaeroides DSM 2875 TaxID=1337886 RepID=A0ABM9W7S4_9FIRM|nr:adenine deaminase [Sporomusa sphaeroides]OLS54889.1 adenine deaminase [Sporomusa sphaeroides DSM 2875]CVK21090.1 Adenine deaminase [Sporomusa sphaeroides DSM 2875]